MMMVAHATLDVLCKLPTRSNDDGEHPIFDDRDDDSNDDGGDFEGDERNTNWHFLSAWWSSWLSSSYTAIS